MLFTPLAGLQIRLELFLERFACSLKLRQLFQFLHAPINVGAFDFRRPRQAEALAAERCRDAAVNHREPDVVVHRALRRGKKTHHAADE